MSTTFTSTSYPQTSSTRKGKKMLPPSIKHIPAAKPSLAQSQNLPAPPPSPTKARSQNKLRKHGASSSISSITGKTPLKAAQEAATRAARRSHSPPALRSGLEGHAAGRPQPALQPTAACEAAPSSSDPSVIHHRLPLNLPHPKVLAPFNPNFIKVVEPDWEPEKCSLENLALYVGLNRTRQCFMRGIGAVDMPTSPPPLDFPPSITLPIKPDVSLDSAYLPTHMMVITDSKTGKGTVCPIQSVVMATQCARLPDLPAPAPRRPDENGNVIFPYYHLTVSHGPSFQVLYQYWYHRSQERLLQSILGLGPAEPRLKFDPNKKFDEMAQDIVDVLVERFSSNALLDKLRWIYGLWSNVLELGVSNTVVWHWMETSWRLVLKAMVDARKQEGNPIPNAK